MDSDGFIVYITYAFKLIPRIVILLENSCTLGVTFDGSQSKIAFINTR